MGCTALVEKFFPFWRGHISGWFLQTSTWILRKRIHGRPVCHLMLPSLSYSGVRSAIVSEASWYETSEKQK